MNYLNLSNDLANDYRGNVDINAKYQFTDDMWMEIYKFYIKFPLLKSESSSYYVANEPYISNLISELKNNISKVEHLIDLEDYQFCFSKYAYLEFLNYKLIGSAYEDIEFDNFDDQLKLNLIKVEEYIKNNEITVANITEVYKLLSHSIIEFHPVQGANMYRAVDLSIYNQFDRLIMICVDMNQISQHMHDLVELCNLNNKRDEYANFLMSNVLKAHMIRISPFYRYNEIMADIIVTWFLSKQQFVLPYVATHQLFKLDYQAFTKGLEDLRFSAMSRDLTVYIAEQIKMLNRNLHCIELLKNASDISVGDLDLLTTREQDYIKVILNSHLYLQFFNWEMLNDELKRSNMATTKAGVLKILNRLVDKQLLNTKVVGKSKLFKINL